MKTYVKLTACALLMMTALSACSSHCTCPPQTAAQPSSTTIIHEPSDNY